jgi:DNA-binding NarL/FixJ family response regulator
MPPKDELGANPLFVLDSAGLDAPAAEYVRSMTARFSHARYIVLDHKLDVWAVSQLLSLGIHGFLVYEQVFESLPLAIRSVRNGGIWVDSRVLQLYMRLDKRKRDSLTSIKENTSLTGREEEVLHLARQRLSNKEIATTLNVEVSTVKYHLSNIFSKLRIASRSDLWRHSSFRPVTLVQTQIGNSGDNTAMPLQSQQRVRCD